MNNYGNCNGKQVVREKWIQKTITPSDKAPFYGYLWWIYNNSEDKNFTVTRDFGQMIIVFPDIDLIY